MGGGECVGKTGGAVCQEINAVRNVGLLSFLRGTDMQKSEKLDLEVKGQVFRIFQP